MGDSTPLNPQILGQAESAHRALLDRILADTGLTYHQWAALRVAAVGGADVDRAQLADRMTGALKIDDAAALATVAELIAAKLLEPLPGGESRVALTDAGQDLHRQISTAIKQTIARLYGNIPADDLATAGRVLTAITARIDADLAGYPQADRPYSSRRPAMPARLGPEPDDSPRAAGRIEADAGGNSDDPAAPRGLTRQQAAAESRHGRAATPVFAASLASAPGGGGTPPPRPSSPKTTPPLARRR